MCHRENLTICGPRDHVQMVFSHWIRAANKTAKGEAPTHQTLRSQAKLPASARLCILPRKGGMDRVAPRHTTAWRRHRVHNMSPGCRLPATLTEDSQQ